MCESRLTINARLRLQPVLIHKIDFEPGQGICPEKERQHRHRLDGIVGGASVLTSRSLRTATIGGNGSRGRPPHRQRTARPAKNQTNKPPQKSDCDASSQGGTVELLGKPDVSGGADASATGIS